MKQELIKLIDLSRCTACRGCQVACKQWNELPASKTHNFGSYQNPPDLQWNTWTLIRFQEHVDSNGNLQMAVPQRRLHALHRCRLCQGLPDRGPVPYRIRQRQHACRKMHRLQGVCVCLPLRCTEIQCSDQQDQQMRSLLHPSAGQSAAGLRPLLPDRGPARSGPRTRC